MLAREDKKIVGGFVGLCSMQPQPARTIVNKETHILRLHESAFTKIPITRQPKPVNNAPRREIHPEQELRYELLAINIAFWAS